MPENKVFVRNLVLSLMFLFIAPMANADEQPEVWMKNDWSYAINGYDTVAYFTQNEPVDGDDRFVTEYKGVN